jgi:AcrR family transcriptional regulator
VTEAPKGERGRPRSGTNPRPDLSATEQILDAAAHLFVERGYSATSTRAIADEVGIRQASLYYHFQRKEQILELLLMRTVEPSMRVANYLKSSEAPATVRLTALVTFDGRQLFTAPHNVGSLYLLPEVRNGPFEQFRFERSSLRGLYARLISESIDSRMDAELGRPDDAAPRASLDYLVDVVFGMVESVITIRADRSVDDATLLTTTIAESCLRVLGHDGAEIRGVVADADSLLADMSDTLGLGAGQQPGGSDSD